MNSSNVFPRAISAIPAAATRMSSSSFSDSGGIDQRAMGVGNLEEEAVRHGARFHQIDLPTQKTFQLQFQPHVTFERSLPTQFSELNKKINVTMGRVKIATRRRAEKLEARDLVLLTQGPNLDAMLFNQRQHAYAEYTSSGKKGGCELSH